MKEPAPQITRANELARPEPKVEALRELVAHLRQNRALLRKRWVARITEARLLTAMTREEIFAEANSVYDSCVAALETGTFEALQAYARNLSECVIPRGVETHEVVGSMLLLLDEVACSVFAKRQTDFEQLILDAYEPTANRIANTVAVGFMQERERTNRAKVVVLDITGVAAMDVTVANHLVQSEEASRPLGIAAAETQIPIASEKDVVTARHQGRAVALQTGFSASEATLIATAISELARNIICYADQGSVTLRPVHRVNGTVGLTIIVSDLGPGIIDVTQALRDGYSTSGGLGLGLPGARRLMDEFDITSQAGVGTTITVTKWLP